MTDDENGPTKCQVELSYQEHNENWCVKEKGSNIFLVECSDWSLPGHANAQLCADAFNVYAETGLTPREMVADITFLLGRAMQAEMCSFSSDGRDCGASSNSIVGIAYGLVPLVKQEMPSDNSDLNACLRMWEKLPKHRKCGDAFNAMEKAKKALSPEKKEGSHEQENVRVDAVSVGYLHGNCSWMDDGLPTGF